MVVVLVPIAVILGAYVAYAASQQSHAWADAIVRGFTAWLASLPLAGAAVERLIASGATWISNKLGHYFLEKAERVINWLGGLGHYVWMIANATLDWPVELVSFARWLLGQEIPHLIRGLPTAVSKLVHDAQKIIGGLERDVARLYAHLPGQVRKLIHAGLIGLLGPFLLPLRWLLHNWRQVSHAAAVAGGIAVPWVAVPKIWKRLYSQNLRLSRVEKLLGVTAFSLALSRVLRVSPRCIRTGNIGRISRALCGLSARAFEDILGLLVDLFLLSNICQAIVLIEDGFSFIEPEITAFITAVETMACYGNDEHLPPGPPVFLSLPPVTGLVLPQAA